MAYTAYRTGGYTMGAAPVNTPEVVQSSKFTTMFEKALHDFMKKQTTPKDTTAQDAGGRFMFGPQMRAGE